MAPQQDTARQQAQQIRERLNELAGSIEGDIGKVDDPKAQALFETSREVLKGLATAFQHYEQRSERAWE